MAIHESKKQTDLEKRLKLLRQQVYGKENRESSVVSFQLSGKTKKIDDSYSDITYLKQDLLKILLLSSLAIGAQAILFLSLKNHFLNLNFF